MTRNDIINSNGSINYNNIVLGLTKTDMLPIEPPNTSGGLALYNNTIPNRLINKRILIIGDLLTLPTGTWTENFAQKIVSVGGTITNLSEFGLTSAGMLTKIGTINGSSYDIVILHVGINDFLGKTPYGNLQSPASGTFVKNYFDTISHLMSTNINIEIYCCGTTLQTNQWWKSNFNGYNVRTYNQLISSIALATGQKFLDMTDLPAYSNTNGYWTNDGITWKSSFSSLISDIIYNKILNSQSDVPKSFPYCAEYKNTVLANIPYFSIADSNFSISYALINDFGNGQMQVHIQGTYTGAVANDEKAILTINDHFGSVGSLFIPSFEGSIINFYDVGTAVKFKSSGNIFLNFGGTFLTANSNSLFVALADY